MYLQNTVKKVSIDMKKMISVFVIWVLGSGSEFSVWAYRN